jgi:hypothetical protein
VLFEGALCEQVKTNARAFGRMMDVFLIFILDIAGVAP